MITRLILISKNLKKFKVKALIKRTHTYLPRLHDCQLVLFLVFYEEFDSSNSVTRNERK